MLPFGGSQRAPGGAEMDVAPRRAALRGGLRLATGKVVAYVVDPVTRSTRRDRRCVRVLLLSGSAAITMSLGSMETGLSREWMSTPAKNGEDAWLLEAHAL